MASHASPPPSKKKKRCAVYRTEMTEKYPCLVRSSRGAGYIHCTTCLSHFSVDSGMNDCDRHIKGPNHKKHATSMTGINTLDRFALTTSTSGTGSLVEAVTNAEVLFTGFLVEHNIPLAAADHAAQLFKAMFTNSAHSAAQIISNYRCARTKTTHIVNELANDERSSLIDALKSGPFSLATDASNDRQEKLYPIVVRLFKDGGVRTELLSVIEVSGKNTGENIAHALSNELKKKNIPWSNVVSFVTDNANVMVGSKQGCYGHLLKENPKLISTGCVCHRLHLAAEWAGKQLPVNVEQFFLDIYYYIEKSACRVKSLKDCQEACGVAQSQLCKHCPTRWLSLRKTCIWVLEQWNALEKFFELECGDESQEAETLNAQEQAQSRKKKVLDNLKSRSMKVYVSYLAFVLEQFDKVNLEMQIEAPMIHLQKRLIQRFIRTLMQMFLKPCAITGKEVTDVDFKSAYNILPKERLMVGEDTRELVGKMNTERKAEFFVKVQKFLQTAVTYMLKHGKLEEDYLRHAEVADIALKDKAKWSSLNYFIEEFPSFLPLEASKDELRMEFSSYQISAMPSDLSGKPMDEQWKIVGEKVQDEVGSKCLKYLPQVMQHILAIPHSNASCERIFSLVRKNRTDFRASMSLDTLESLLILKQKGVVCHQRKTSSKLLRSCKEATKQALLGDTSRH